MKVITLKEEFTFDDLVSWIGCAGNAIEFFEKVKEAGKEEQFMDEIAARFDDGMLSDLDDYIEINWDDILEELGIMDEEDDDEDEDEDEDEEDMEDFIERNLNEFGGF